MPKIVEAVPNFSEGRRPEIIKAITDHVYQYFLSINIEGNGEVTKNPDQNTFTYGTVVELTANADSGWSFSHWSGDLNNTNSTENIFINNTG